MYVARSQSRSQSLRYPCPAERATRDSGIKCFRSTFHWLEKEHAQLNRKLKENNFVPRFPKSKPRTPRTLRTIAFLSSMADKIPDKSLPRPLKYSVSESDGLPRKIYRNCHTRLKQFSEFKDLCQRSRTEQENSVMQLDTRKSFCAKRTRSKAG